MLNFDMFWESMCFQSAVGLFKCGVANNVVKVIGGYKNVFSLCNDFFYLLSSNFILFSHPSVEYLSLSSLVVFTLLNNIMRAMWLK